MNSGPAKNLSELAQELSQYDELNTGIVQWAASVSFWKLNLGY